MSELEKILKDVVYGGVGAVASMLETGSGLAKTFVEKGQKIVQQAKPAAEDWARKVQETCDEAVKATGVDIGKLSREQRDQLAALMTKLNKVEDAAARALKNFMTDMEQADAAEEADETIEVDESEAAADAVDAEEAPEVQPDEEIDIQVEDAPGEEDQPNG